MFYRKIYSLTSLRSTSSSTLRRISTRSTTSSSSCVATQWQMEIWCGAKVSLRGSLDTLTTKDGKFLICLPWASEIRDFTLVHTSTSSSQETLSRSVWVWSRSCVKDTLVSKIFSLQEHALRCLSSLPKSRRQERFVRTSQTPPRLRS